MTSASLITVFVSVAALGLGYLGFLFAFADRTIAFQRSGHMESALPQVMGGRYVGLAVFLIALAGWQNYEALTLALLIGGAFGFWDGFVTKRHGGQAGLHFAAGLMSFLLAFWSASLA